MHTDSSSDEDDDSYINAAARLKRLKKKPSVPIPDPTEETKQDGYSDYWSSKTPTPPSQSSDRVNLRSTKTISSPKRSTKNNCAKREPSPDLQLVTIELDDDDDDDDKVEQTVVTSNESFDSLNYSIDCGTCIDDDNYTLDVKVRWKSREIVRLPIKKYESFQKIFQHFAELEGVSDKQIIIYKNDKPISRTDTPASLDLKVINILEGGIVTTENVFEEQNEDTENVCKIKVQMSTKQKIVVNLRMDETFKTVVMTCAQQLDVAPTQIKLSFDGDEISLTDTPESLDLEQEACIDLRVLPS